MRALRQREAELVQHWKPKFDIMYRNMLDDPSLIPKSPTTLEELFDPLVTVMNRLGDTGDASSGNTNNIAK